MNRLRDGTVRSVCKVNRVTCGICNSIAESRLKSNIDNLHSPRLNIHATTVINDSKGEFLSTNGNIFGHIEGVFSLNESTRHNGRTTEFPSVVTVNQLAVRVGRRIVDFDFNLVCGCCDNRRRCNTVNNEVCSCGCTTTATASNNKLTLNFFLTVFALP